MESRPRNYEKLLVAVTFVVIVMVVVWSAQARYRDFLRYHGSIAASAVGELGGAIDRIILERHRLVRLFAEDHAALILALRNDPDDFNARDRLSRAIARYFPGYFTFTLVDRSGQQLLQDFEGYVGELCLADVATFARSGVNNVRVHPNAFVYHFDVMTEWGDSDSVLLISFPADELSGLIRASQAPGHELMLVQPDEGYLIEIVDQGARDQKPRNDFRMRTDEQTRILAEKEIAHSKWALIDSIKQDFVSEYQRRRLVPMAALIVVFGIFSVTVGWMIHRNELIRRRTNKIKADFVSVVSHELRTPLTSIQGALSLLEAGACGEIGSKVKEMLGIALNNTDRLRLLVDDLLDMRKIESGKLALDRSDHDIMTLVRTSVEQNQGYALRFDVRFAIREAVEKVNVQVDALRICQVLTNLLSNAAKYSHPGGVVDIFVRGGEDGQIEVAVRDQGPGVDPSFQKHLFEKFAQGDDGDSRRSSGTGLGLAIVKALVEAHGGSVGFRQNTGLGSTFYFRLPCVSALAE